jgi:hypothetical protein
MSHMRGFERSIRKRTTPQQCAEEIYRAITDDSDRLRYPVAAYARALSRLRRLAGAEAFMRLFHPRWMGPDS